MWAAGTASFRPAAAHAANCELRAARLRANVALRSPESVPLAILAACYGVFMKQQDSWDENAYRRAAPTTAAWSARAAAAAGRSAGVQRVQIGHDALLCCSPSKRQRLECPLHTKLRVARLALWAFVFRLALLLLREHYPMAQMVGPCAL